MKKMNILEVCSEETLVQLLEENKFSEQNLTLISNDIVHIQDLWVLAKMMTELEGEDGLEYF